MKPIISTVLKVKIDTEYNKMLENWNVSYEETEIMNEYGITHVILAGNEKNTPLIFLHDAIANSALWSDNIDELSGKYYCILIDRIGSPGKSIPGKSYNNNFNQHAWLDSILMELNIEKCFAVGVGTGADILLDYMLYNPGVRKLICIEGGIKIHKNNMIIPLIGLESMFLSSKLILKKLAMYLKPSEDFFHQNANIFNYILLLVKGYNHLAIKHQKSQVSNAIYINQIRNKILFIFGENGTNDKYEQINMIVSKNLSYEVIENCGHLVNIEKAEIVNLLIVDFLEGMKSV